MVSVTQILDQFPEKELVEWQLRDPKKAKQVSEEALRVGKLVDSLTQAQWRMERVELPPNEPMVECAWRNWNTFLTESPGFLTSIRAIQQEIIVDDLLGHPDFIREVEDAWGIDDLKCASQIRASHFVQLGGYAWLMQQSQPSRPRPSWLGIIRLEKERPGYEYLQLTKWSDMELAISAFLHYRAMYQMREIVKGWVLEQREDAALCITE